MRCGHAATLEWISASFPRRTHQLQSCRTTIRHRVRWRVIDGRWARSQAICIIRFFRQPSRASATRPVIKSGSPEGSGVVDTPTADADTVPNEL